jgi:hypothetical protein
MYSLGIHLAENAPKINALKIKTAMKELKHLPSPQSNY